MLTLVIVALLVVLGAAGWWWTMHSGDAVSDNTTAAVAVPSGPAAPTVPPATNADPGPMLRDEQGQLIASRPAKAIRAFYRALDPYDPAALDRVTQPGTRATVHVATAAPATRETLRQVMRTTRITHQDEGLVYRGPDGLQLAIGPDTALVYDLILPGSDRASGSTRAAGSGATVNTAAGAEPTLGAADWTPDTVGYGGVRPAEANAGGDGTSVLTELRWKTWGGPTATATGTGSWVAPDAAIYQGVAATAVVTASDLGPCHGHLAYRKLTWYFPTHGETATHSQVTGYPNICSPS